jgi:hypothetical protein
MSMTEDIPTLVRKLLARNTHCKEIEQRIEKIAKKSTDTHWIVPRMVSGFSIVDHGRLRVTVDTIRFTRRSFAIAAQASDIRVSPLARLERYYDVAEDVLHTAENIKEDRLRPVLMKYSKYLEEATVILGEQEEFFMSLPERSAELLKRMGLTGGMLDISEDAINISLKPKPSGGQPISRVVIQPPTLANVDTVDQVDKLLDFLQTFCTW